MSPSDIAANALAIAALDRIDYDRPHREQTLDLPCKLSPREYEAAGDEFAKAVRVRESLEIEAAQSAKHFKARIETATADERRRLRILETHTEERPIPVKELWAKKGGEDTIVTVRLDLFTGVVDPLCYVTERHPQPLDRQTKMEALGGGGKRPPTEPSEDHLQRQADAALASSGEPMPFEIDEDTEDVDVSLVAMPGAEEPEQEIEAKPLPKKGKAKGKAKAWYGL
jgi:hypothetical protein